MHDKCKINLNFCPKWILNAWRTRTGGLPIFCWVYKGTVPPWNGTIPNLITFSSGLISYLIEEPIKSRSAQLPYKHKAYPCKPNLILYKKSLFLDF